MSNYLFYLACFIFIFAVNTQIDSNEPLVLIFVNTFLVAACTAMMVLYKIVRKILGCD